MSKTLVLRVCKPDFTSYNGFKWPEETGAVVEAPDWDATLMYSGGLHGWLHGEGIASYVDYYNDEQAKWFVLEVPTAEVVKLNGKCKFPRATVLFIGSMGDAARFVVENDPDCDPTKVIGLTAVGCVADLGTATAGDYSTAAAGYNGTATAGDYSTATAGRYGTAIAGDYSTAIAGYEGTATAGNYGTAIAGDYSTATAGYNGTAAAGNYGTAIAGNYGTATAGNYGTATAGNNGIIQIRIYDKDSGRYRIITGYVGEDGIKPNVKYKLNSDNNFEEVTE